jgi:hypothetical protein
MLCAAHFAYEISLEYFPAFLGGGVVRFPYEMSCFGVHTFRMRFPYENSCFLLHNLLMRCHAFGSAVGFADEISCCVLPMRFHKICVL